MLTNINIQMNFVHMRNVSINWPLKTHQQAVDGARIHSKPLVEISISTPRYKKIHIWIIPG